MILRRRLIPATILAALTFALAASAKLTNVGAPDVQFLAIGPAGMQINGTSKELSADEKDGKLIITAPLTNLKTGIGLRDKHLRGYLHTDKHPKARLVVDKSKLKMPDNNKTVESSATGDFTMNGITKPVKFKYKAKRTGSDYHVLGGTEIDIGNFDIEQPCYLGVCVEKKIKLKVVFKLRDK